MKQNLYLSFMFEFKIQNTSFPFGETEKEVYSKILSEMGGSTKIEHFFT
jgi:hypothetical protein